MSVCIDILVLIKMERILGTLDGPGDDIAGLEGAIFEGLCADSDGLGKMQLPTQVFDVLWQFMAYKCAKTAE